MDLNHRSPGYEPTGYPDYPTSLPLAPRFTVFKPPSPVHHENGCIDEVEGPPSRMRAARVKAMAALAVLVCASLAGCLSTVDDGDDENPITMTVHYESTSGTILERVKTGPRCLKPVLSWPLTSPGHLKGRSDDDLYPRSGDDEDGSNAITVNANDQAEITYTYQTHGLFTVVLSATDESGNEASTNVIVRIDKTTDWTQSNTDDPDSMVVPTTLIASARRRNALRLIQPSAIHPASSRARP